VAFLFCNEIIRLKAFPLRGKALSLIISLQEKKSDAGGSLMQEKKSDAGKSFPRMQGGALLCKPSLKYFS
jgi:hypothetical protein